MGLYYCGKSLCQCQLCTIHRSAHRRLGLLAPSKNLTVQSFDETCHITIFLTVPKSAISAQTSPKTALSLKQRRWLGPCTKAVA